MNLNLVSSSKLRLSFIIGRVGTLGGRAGNPGGGGQGWGPVYHPVHAMFPGAHLDTLQGWDFSNSSAHNVPRCILFHHYSSFFFFFLHLQGNNIDLARTLLRV